MNYPPQIPESMITEFTRWQCLSCVHLNRETLNEWPTCAVFPQGIPNDIRLGVFDHRQKRPLQSKSMLWTHKEGEPL